MKARLTCLRLVPMAAALFNIAVVASQGTAAQTASATSQTPPKGAVILFDGANQDAWVSQTYKKWEDSDGPADWKIIGERVLEVVPNAGSLISRQKFGDFRIHFEFKLPQGDVNGGVFLLARYEFGINGSAAAPEGLACGAFENLEHPVRPKGKALSPPDQWHSVDIDFRAPRLGDNGKAIEDARATARLNGVVIHENVELGRRKGAASRLGDAATGHIMLQDHGQAYQFRNIWLVDKSPATKSTNKESQ